VSPSVSPLTEMRERDSGTTLDDLRNPNPGHEQTRVQGEPWGAGVWLRRQASL
jgi:hypothetical protein